MKSRTGLLLTALRGDRDASDCRLPHTRALPEPARVIASTTPPRVIPGNTDKLFWPEPGFTKGDLLAYYRAIAPWIVDSGACVP